MVVVGAGSAGLTAAWRLSDDPDTEVVVLEAGVDPGGRVPPPLRRGVEIPAQYYWDYHDADDGTFLPRGRVIGGSSAVNYAGATRAGSRSYDDWNLPGWSFADCMAAFRAIETDVDFGHLPYHGDAGPTPVVRRPMDDRDAPLAQVYDALGYAEVPDHNAAADAFGYGPFPSNLLGHDRASTLLTLLPILRARPNVTVRGRSEVVKVLLRGGTAVGVQVHDVDVDAGVIESVEADHVLLTAGVYGTPEILFASGVGPAKSLAAAGIRVVVAKDEVGRNLREHPRLLLNVEVTFSTPPAHPLLMTTALGDDPARLAHVFPFVGLVPGLPDTMASFVCALLGPTSTGHLDLTPGRARVHRRLAGTRADLAGLAELVERVGTVVDELALRGLATLPEDPIWRGHDRRLPPVLGYNHPVGTCRMGVDEGSVTDLNLRVRGVERLMIADASVMPDIPRSQTNLPAMMIGYRAAQFLETHL